MTGVVVLRKPQERRTKTGRRNPTAAERNAGPLDDSKKLGGLEELCTMWANCVT